MDNLAGVSVILVCIAMLMFAASFALDRRVADKRIDIKLSKSMRMMRPRNVAVLLLTYAAIAFSQDIALEWLASIAILVCCGASLLRRGVTLLMVRGDADPTADPDACESPVDLTDKNVTSEQGNGNGTEERPLVVAGRMTEMLADILVYVSALDLILLFVMALVEKVIPYYINLAIG